MAINPIRNHLLFRAVQFTPLVILVVVALIFLAPDDLKFELSCIAPCTSILDYSPKIDFIFISGLGAASASLAAFGVFLRLIPETFDTLWQRNVVAARSAALSDHNQVQEQYRKFVQSIEQWLNSPWQWASCLVFACIVPSIIWLPKVLIWPLNFGTAWFIIELLCGFLIGFLLWYVFVIGSKVWQLGRQFDLRLKLGHLDKCAGLEPLGKLCLWNALLVGIGPAFLGSWILILKVYGPNFPVPYSQDVYPVESFIDALSRLLWFLVTAAFFGFVLPVWSVHQVMIVKRKEIQRQLDHLAEEIDSLDRDLLNRLNTGASRNNTEKVDRLAQLRQTYQVNQNIPVWPVNISILTKFAVVQIIPLLSLLNLEPPIKEIISNLLKFLTGDASTQ